MDAIDIRSYLFLLIAIGLASLSDCTPSWAQKGQAAPEKEPSLSCRATIKGLKSIDVQLDCTIENSSPDYILVLASPLTMEGPRSEQTFPRRHTGGDRHENVLVYDRGVVDLSEPGIVFDPLIFLTTEELSTLLKVPRGARASFSVVWQPSNAMLATSSDGWWTVRMKIIYLSETWLETLEDNDLVTESCRKHIITNLLLKSQVWPGEVSLPTREWRKEAGRQEADICHQLISERFIGLYSNQIGLDLTTG